MIGLCYWFFIGYWIINRAAFLCGPFSYTYIVHIELISKKQLIHYPLCSLLFRCMVTLKTKTPCWKAGGNWGDYVRVKKLWSMGYVIAYCIGGAINKVLGQLSW